MNTFDFFASAQQAVVDYAQSNMGETIEKESIELIYSSQALNIHKAIAVDNTTNKRLWVISYDRFSGQFTVEVYLPVD